MSEITQRHVLLMWVLLFTGEEPKLSKAKPKFTKKELSPLLDAGLVELVRRGPGSNIVLTDRAWQWAEDNLDVQFSHSINGARALKGLLPRLKNYMKSTGTPLVELLTAEARPETEVDADVRIPGALVATPEPEAAPAAAPESISIDEAIRMAYLSLTHNQWETRVRLADLRPQLTLYPRDDQDEALKRMQTEGRLLLFPLDDPQDINDADREAALYLGSDPRHLVYMKG